MNPVLETRGITKSFGAVEASRGISLDLRPGEIHALIGPNGAGKSTLIQQIAGKLRPDAGSVHLLGEDVTALGVAERARAGLGRTFQVSALAMEDTVLQNAVLRSPTRSSASIAKERACDLWISPWAMGASVIASRIR